MPRRIRIEIRPDGRILAKTDGIKGKACTNYIALIEEILDAQTATSEYTAEHKESYETLDSTQRDVQKLRETE